MEMVLTKRQQTPHKEGVGVIPQPQAEVPECREFEAFREIVLRSQTIEVPVVEQERSEVPAGSEAFDLSAVEGLPARYRQMLMALKIDPFRVLWKGDGSIAIGCGFCSKEFGTLKGWRIHASKTHRQNGFCQKCGHFVSMLHATFLEGIAAMMELHSME